MQILAIIPRRIIFYVPVNELKCTDYERFDVEVLEPWRISQSSVNIDLCMNRTTCFLKKQAFKLKYLFCQSSLLTSKYLGTEIKKVLQ